MSSNDEENARRCAELLAFAITNRTEFDQRGQAVPAEQLQLEKRLGIVRRQDWLPDAFVNKMEDPTQLSEQEIELHSHKAGKLLDAMNKQMSRLDDFKRAGASDEASVDKLFKEQDWLEKKNKKSKKSILVCAVCLTHTTNRCDRCKKVFYCTRECQLKHWKLHKKNCRAVEASP
jgi:hypothetical protein